VALRGGERTAAGRCGKTARGDARGAWRSVSFEDFAGGVCCAASLVWTPASVPMSCGLCVTLVSDKWGPLK
jgi:hypothetical protein